MNQRYEVELPAGKVSLSRQGLGSSQLLMLHGVTRRWQTYLPILPTLQSFWDIHCLDFRGHGMSDHGGEYRVVDYAADVIALLQDSFEGPVWIYGHSLGAMVAAAVGAALPEVVAGVVLEDPPLHTMGSRIGETILLSHFKAMRNFAGSNLATAEMTAQLAKTKLFDPVKDCEVLLGDTRDATALRFSAGCLRKLDPRVLDPIIAASWLEDYSVEDVFRKLRCPALLLQGDDQAGGMLIDHDAASVAQWAEDLTLIKFPKCGHSIHWAKTQQLLNHVHAFLGGLESGEAT